MGVPNEVGEFEDELRSYLSENVLAEGVAFDADTALESIGVDSYALMELILHIERKYEMSVPLAELTPENVACVRSLSVLLHRMVQEGPARN